MDIEIIANSRSHSATRVSVCSHERLKVPPQIALGTGDKASRYEQYLNSNLDSDERSKGVMNFTMARLLAAASTTKKLSVVCECGCNRFHAQVLCKVLRERQQALSSLFGFLDKESEYLNQK